MKPFWKSMTLQGLGALVITAGPTVIASALNARDPLWSLLADVGMADRWIAAAKLAAFVGGVAAVAYGRVRASQPLGK